MSDSTVSGTSSLSSINGIGGLASGIDTDSLVKKLVSTEQTKIDKQNQQVTKLEWQQEAYREIISKMQTFQSKYLDSLSKTDITRSSSFNTVSATSSNKAVSVLTNADSYAGKFSITSITQLASGKKITSAKASKVMQGTVNMRERLASEGSVYSNPSATDEELKDTLVGSLAGKSLSFTLDGTTKVITFDAGTDGTSFMENFYSNLNSDGSNASDAFAAALESKLDAAFGADRINVSFGGEGGISFTTVDSSRVSVYAVNEDNEPLEMMGLENGVSSKITASKQLSGQAGFLATELTASRTETVTEGEGDKATDRTVSYYKFKINGVEFEVNNDSSLSSIMSKINNSQAGVTLSYSELTDTFVMTSKETGFGSEVKLEDMDGGNFLAALGLTGDSATAPTVEEGQNAVFVVDGTTTVERSTNTNINVNGVFISLSEVTDEAVDIEMKEDTSSMKDLITNFVNDYNEMIELLNKTRTEERVKGYDPLTEAQKEEMSDKQIEKWEEKAKAGVLRNDSTLNAISSKLSQLMYTSFNGFSLYEMGVQSAGYTENGKLTIDETKLDEALSTKSAKIKDFFLGDTGFGAALEKAMDGAIKTSGPKGSRGSLIEKAGIGNTMSDTENNISDKIKSLKKFIDNLNTKLAAREKYWWSKFSTLEKLVNNMNSKSSIIQSYASM